MYRAHFGLRDKPFQIVPSPKFLFPSETHDEGRARLHYGIRESRGFVVVTGDVGLGKTTVMLSVLEELDATVRTALIFSPVDTFVQLLRLASHEFGLPGDSDDEVHLLNQLNTFLVEQLAQNRTCVLIIDEAQNLPVPLLEKIRLLSNLQTEETSLLQIVLIGQPELYQCLQDPGLRQLRQRIGVWYEMRPLDREETSDYAHHRLRLAGARRPKEIFPTSACDNVHAYTGGIPRLINQLCDTTLVIAFGQDAQVVTVGHVDEAALELHLVNAPVAISRPPASAPGPAPSLPQRPLLPGRVAESSGSWAGLRQWAALAAIAALVVVAVALASSEDEPSPPTLSDEPEQSVSQTGPIEPDSAEGDADGAVLAPHEPEVAEGDGIEPEAAVSTSDEGQGQSDTNDLSSSVTVGSSADRVGAAVAVPDPAQEPASAVFPPSEVEGWRSQGRAVYSVHLASFLDRANAEAFANDWSGEPGQADTPLFLEPTDGSPVWYRVMGGGFLDRSAAKAWLGILKREQRVTYAQVDRLAATAQSFASFELGENRR